MSNIATLTQAGIIGPTAKLSPADQQIIESLTPTEVQALISIRAKLTPEFMSNNFSGTQSSLGIVF
ncbi:MAG TPA: aroma-sacti cluster domain-containing protein [Terriglobales bacterium]|jgi:hypothetical protein|nr:aroma-sacti cluster domain-containing protein [Terriglobales bacterium]